MERLYNGGGVKATQSEAILVGVERSTWSAFSVCDFFPVGANLLAATFGRFLGSVPNQRAAIEFPESHASIILNA